MVENCRDRHNNSQVTRLLKENCVIPERYEKYGPDASKEDYGIRWQCPWGKHTPANFKYNHTAPKNENINKDDCLPVVTVRNPFDWMTSMCRHPYTTRWERRESGKSGEICPHLVQSDTPNKALVGVEVKLAEKWLHYDSLAHLWTEWYANYYKEATYPVSSSQINAREDSIATAPKYEILATNEVFDC